MSSEEVFYVIALHYDHINVNRQPSHVFHISHCPFIHAYTSMNHNIITFPAWTSFRSLFFDPPLSLTRSLSAFSFFEFGSLIEIKYIDFHERKWHSKRLIKICSATSLDLTHSYTWGSSVLQFHFLFPGIFIYVYHLISRFICVMNIDQYTMEIWRCDSLSRLYNISIYDHVFPIEISLNKCACEQNRTESFQHYKLFKKFLFCLTVNKKKMPNTRRSIISHLKKSLSLERI